MSATTHPGATSAPPPTKRHPYRQWAPDLQALNLLGDKWTLPIIRHLAAGPKRFVELQRSMDGISTEQLRSRLNRMVADGLLTRQRYREVPPRVDYELTHRAIAAFPAIGAMARWGLQFTWGAPRPGETVNVAELFNLAPMLVTGYRRAAIVTLTVIDDAGERKTVTVTLPRGAGVYAEVARELPAGEADAMVSGTVGEWAGAFAPGSEGVVPTSSLSVRGDEQLAAHVVAQLTGRG
ncbi:MAG TPA: helix-turn-helix domain-containing protein [Solirubrobacteraceae bacterium]